MTTRVDDWSDDELFIYAWIMVIDLDDQVFKSLIKPMNFHLVPAVIVDSGPATRPPIYRPQPSPSPTLKYGQSL